MIRKRFTNSGEADSLTWKAALHFRDRLNKPLSAVYHATEFHSYIRMALEAAGNRVFDLFDEIARGFLIPEPEIEAGLCEILEIGISE